MAEFQHSVNDPNPIVIWEDAPSPSVPSNTDQSNPAAAMDAARQLYLFLQTYTTFRLIQPVAAEQDCIGLHDLAIILLAPNPPSASLIALSQLPLDSLHIHCTAKCSPSELLDMFGHIYDALLSDPETRNYTLRLRSFALSWGANVDTTLHERLFTLCGWRKAQVGEGRGKWPTFLSAMNDEADVGVFKLEMELRDEKDYEILKQVVDSVEWDGERGRHRLIEVAPWAEMRGREVRFEGVE